ncbi:SDR family oxidoreductase [Mycobacterium sp. ITM-2016-00318]|uniref:SDR family oxidoreductase n=1 Tax=Mycobacterium sp. ITM-2016-00318 TaxID=2099693 RepID=UPI000CF9430E|nr:SDR family oxidoreductase [Mycobacterium sp. ITM-2016-00318]WNG90851.1 SDR family oxidoreductase [Mycobacterium sp. ITM-2016-00318]
MTTINLRDDKIVALVTGANRGLGKRFATELVARGATVYAAARRPETIDIPGVVPVALDITDPESVRRAAEIAADVNVLVNNAGVSTQSNLLSGPVDDIRLEMETHYFGTLQTIRAFVPVIEGNGGGAILDVLSVLSWVHAAQFGAYSAAKAAGWAMTDAVREELAPLGIHVAALHVGFMDTDMAEFVPADQKLDPAVVAAQALDGLFAGEPEILADELTRTVRSQLSRPPLVADYTE